MQLKTNVLFSRQTIAERVAELGKEIMEFYKNDDKPIICVCVLRGAVMFFADLMKELPGDRISFDFITLSSYEATGTTGNVRLIQDIRSSVDGAHVLIVEDIVDSGYTLSFLKQYFADKNAADVKIATLLDKPLGRKVDICADFTAFVLERNAFIIGYGLDLDQKYRNIDSILEVIQ